MTLSEFEGHFCCLKPLYMYTRNAGNVARFNYDVFTHKSINQTAHMARDLSFIVKIEGLLKVTGIQMYSRSGIISKTVLETGCCNDRPLTASDIQPDYW